MEPIKINLATFEYQDKRISYPLMLVVAIIVLVLSILSIRSGINAPVEIREYEDKLAAYDQGNIKRQQIKKETITRLNNEEIESLRKDIDFINGLIKTDAYPYDRLLEVLELCVPQGVVLSDFLMSKNLEKVTLKGKADSMDEITVFLNNLTASDIFKDNNLLNLSISQKHSTQEGTSLMDDGITFEIESVIEGSKIWIER